MGGNLEVEKFSWIQIFRNLMKSKFSQFIEGGWCRWLLVPAPFALVYRAGLDEFTRFQSVKIAVALFERLRGHVGTRGHGLWNLEQHRRPGAGSTWHWLRR